MVHNLNMEKPKKRTIAKLDSIRTFEEKDHRLACGWHVELEGSGQRKRYLKELQAESSAESESIKNP